MLEEQRGGRFPDGALHFVGVVFLLRAVRGQRHQITKPEILKYLSTLLK